MKDETELKEKGVSKYDVKTHHILAAIASNKWKLLVLSIAIYISSVYILKYKFVEYSSTVCFTLNSIPVAEPVSINTNNADLNLTGGLERVTQLAKSDNMLNHLVVKFSLYRQYGIDTTKEFFYENAIQNLRGRIKVSIDQFNMISVSYRDVHRYRAAEIANEIASYLDVLGGTYIVEKLQRKAEISNAVFTDLESQRSKQAGKFDSLLVKMSALLKETDKSVTGKKLIDFERLLYLDRMSIESSVKDLVMMRNIYEWTLQTLTHKKISTITITQKALADTASNTAKSCLMGVGIVLLFWSFFLTAIYGYKKYKNYLKLLFNDAYFKTYNN